MYTTAKLVTSTLIATTILLGCNHTYRYAVKEPIVNSVEDIGSARVSVISVAPWSTYRDALQPKFGLDTKAALEKANVDSRIMAQQSIDSINAVLKFALASEFTETISTQTKDDDETSDSSTSTTTKSPGDLSAVSEPKTPESTIGSLLPDGALPGLGGINERMRLQQASDLFQTAALLDRQVSNVALRSGYVPYVITMKVSVMPNMRNIPYDTYVNLGFFPNPNNREIQVDGEKHSVKLPIAIPLLAVDSLESSVNSAEIGRTREIGLAISALGGNAAGLNIGNISKHLESALGRDTNSLFTMGRLSDNTVRVRIGALQQVSSNFAMVPRTENVTLLVLVDKHAALSSRVNDRLLHIYSYNEFIHATKGHKLRDVTNDRQSEIATKIADLLMLDKLVADDEIESTYNDLWNFVISSNWEQYLSYINKLCHEANENIAACSDNKYVYAEQLWSDIAYYQPVIGEDDLRVEVPRHVLPRIFVSQAAFLSDDKKALTRTTLRGGVNLRSDRLCASLIIYGEDDSKSTDDNVVVPDSISIANDGRDAIVDFPSLEKWGFSDAVKKGGAQLRVKISPSNGVCDIMISDMQSCPDDTYCSSSVRYAYTEKPKDIPPRFALEAQTGFVVADKTGKGVVGINIKPDKKNGATSVKVSIANANLVSYSLGGATTTASGNSVTVNLSGKELSVRLHLDGLAVGESLVISSQDETKGKHAPVTLKVRLNKES